MWQTITPAQATIIAALITLVAAVAGVVLGWWLLSGKVNDLRSALEQSENVIKSHVNSVEEALRGYESRINEQLAALSLQVGQVSGSVADLPLSSSANVLPNQQNAQDSLRESWSRIRDKLEAIASDPAIDGRTRAKYGRIDRRRYADLVAALSSDGKLGGHAPEFRRAVDLWQRFRSGRAVPNQNETADMADLAGRLT